MAYKSCCTAEKSLVVSMVPQDSEFSYNRLPDAPGDDGPVTHDGGSFLRCVLDRSIPGARGREGQQSRAFLMECRPLLISVGRLITLLFLVLLLPLPALAQSQRSATAAKQSSENEKDVERLYYGNDPGLKAMLEESPREAHCLID
jgi:hypothetical protein